MTRACPFTFVLALGVVLVLIQLAAEGTRKGMIRRHVLLIMLHFYMGLCFVAFGLAFCQWSAAGLDCVKLRLQNSSRITP